MIEITKSLHWFPFLIILLVQDIYKYYQGGIQMGYLLEDAPIPPATLTIAPSLERLLVFLLPWTLVLFFSGSLLFMGSYTSCSLSSHKGYTYNGY